MFPGYSSHINMINYSEEALLHYLIVILIYEIQFRIKQIYANDYSK